MTNAHRRKVLRTRRGALALAVVLGAGSFALSGASATHMTVTAVRGSAQTCRAVFNFFGQPQPPVTGTTVTLPPGGSATPITASEPCTVRITFPNGTPGPIILSAASVDVRTQGTTGPTGSVTSTATATDVGTDPNEALQATSITSTCSASEAGVTGSTTVIGGTVVTDQNAGTTAVVPENPTPNYAIEGINGAGDRYRYVFNEQVVNPDGSITVRAVHLYLLGPNATGDVILGEVTCGVTTTTAPTTTSTTTAPTTTSTTTAPTTTSTTTAPTTTST
ncbi:MAG: hypothetical protein M3396_08865, partial [Actinomycetota bacterium]|nr:hypothetical protein [Actinomycetota bacterium]